MTDFEDIEPPETERVKFGSPWTRRFFAFFGISSARAKRERAEE